MRTRPTRFPAVRIQPLRSRLGPSSTPETKLVALAIAAGREAQHLGQACGSPDTFATSSQTASTRPPKTGVRTREDESRYATKRSRRLLGLGLAQAVRTDCG